MRGPTTTDCSLSKQEDCAARVTICQERVRHHCATCADEAGYGADVVRSQKQSPGRADDIVATTIEFITENGVGQLRTVDIAKRLGVSTGLIFYHFETLANLVEHAFAVAAERDLTQLRNTLDSVATQPVLDRLRAVLHHYGPTGNALGWRLWIESWSAGLHDENLRKVVKDMDSQWRQTVAMLIAEGVGSGEFHTPDPHGAAWRLTLLLDGLAVQSVALGGAVTTEEIHRWTEDALRNELGLPTTSA